MTNNLTQYAPDWMDGSFDAKPGGEWYKAEDVDAEIERLDERLETQKSVIANHVIREKELTDALRRLDNGFKYSTEVCNIARWALAGSADEPKPPQRMSRAEAQQGLDAMERAYWKSVEIIDATPGAISTGEPSSAREGSRPRELQPSGLDFDKDLAHLDSVRRTMADMKRYGSRQGIPMHEADFLLSFIDNLWREYSRGQRTKPLQP